MTSLEKAVRAWLALDPAHQEHAILIPQQAMIVQGVSMIEIRGDNIGSLASKLPDADDAEIAGSPDLDESS